MTEDPAGAAPENKMKEAGDHPEGSTEVERKRGHWLALGFMPLPVVVVSLLVIRGTLFSFLSILFGYLLWGAFCSFRVASFTTVEKRDFFCVMGGCLIAVVALLMVLIALLWSACGNTFQWSMAAPEDANTHTSCP